MVDLINETGDTTVAPRSPGKTVTINKQKYKLTAEEYSQMQKRVGEETLKRLQRINPDASNESKLKRVTKALQDAVKKARAELAKQHPELKKLKKLGQ